MASVLLISPVVSFTAQSALACGVKPTCLLWFLAPGQSVTSGEVELCANVSPTDSPTEAHLGFAHAEGGQEVLEKRKMEETEEGSVCVLFCFFRLLLLLLN